MIIGKKLKLRVPEVLEVRRKGRNLIEVSLSSLEAANSLASSQDTLLPETWRAFIPDYGVSRVGAVRDVESSLLGREILEGLEGLEWPFRCSSC